MGRGQRLGGGGPRQKCFWMGYPPAMAPCSANRKSQIYRWTPAASKWEHLDGGLTWAALENFRNLWGVSSSGIA